MVSQIFFKQGAAVLYCLVCLSIFAVWWTHLRSEDRGGWSACARAAGDNSTANIRNIANISPYDCIASFNPWHSSHRGGTGGTAHRGGTGGTYHTGVAQGAQLTGVAQGPKLTQGWHRGHSSQGWHAKGHKAQQNDVVDLVSFSTCFSLPSHLNTKTSFAIWKHVFVQHADDSKISLGCLRWACIRMYITESSTHRNLQNIFWRDTNLFLWSNCVYSVFAKRGEKNNEINFPKYKYSLLWRHN